MRLLPGLLAAIVAYFGLPLLSWLGFSLRFLAFLAIYLIVAVVAERALKRYGKWVCSGSQENQTAMDTGSAF
jgi:membrane protein implicated in regulation of membrane protease activity